MKLSLIIITKNCEKVLEDCLASVAGLVDEIIVIDQQSIDNTIEIAKKYQAQIYSTDIIDYGKKKALALSKIKYNWVLNLDADERISKSLFQEIKNLKNNPQSDTQGYLIPYQNHLFNQPINYGGENYKMLRLFNKKAIIINPALVHEKFELKKGSPKVLINKINHYSYQSLPQMFLKFHRYAISEAKQKYIKKEKPSLKKIFLYPLHMVWARFIKDKGYKDGFFRIILDLGFGYMELITYLYLTYLTMFRIKTTNKKL